MWLEMKGLLCHCGETLVNLVNSVNLVRRKIRDRPQCAEIVTHLSHTSHLIDENKAGFTLVEVLIALSLAMLALLPALAAFNSALKASGRHSEGCRLHVAAATALETRAAERRRGEPISTLGVRQGVERVVVRVRQGEDPPSQTIEVVAERTEDMRRTFARTLFPPIRRVAESVPTIEDSAP